MSENLLKKLKEIQKHIKVYKDQKVAYGNTKYKFRSLEQILAELKPLLDSNGLYVTQSDTIEQVGENIFIKATTTLYDIDTGDNLSNTAYAEIDYTTSMNASQKTGSASSYARKYGLCGILGIEGEEDPDAQKKQEETQKTTSAKKVPVEKIENLFKVLDTKEKQSAFKEVLTEFKYKNSTDILDKDWNAINKTLNEKLKELLETQNQEVQDAREKAPF